MANRSPMATTWQNFLVGTVTLVVVSVGVRTAAPNGWTWPSGTPWWAWTGGLLGIAFIALTAWAVRIVGVLVFGLTSVAGQLLAALGLDLLDPSARPDVGVQLVAGLLITLVAALAAAAANRPRTAG
ncbi:DMT family transporter [Calidifontibacter terrae]